MESHVVEEGVHLRYGLDGVEAVELEGAAVEGRGEVVVAGEVFLLDLELCRPAVSIVHVVGAVNRRAHVESVLGVLRIPVRHVEFRLFLVPGVF